jgi:hypothetical protein
MTKPLKPYTFVTDYVTGKAVPNIGAEENRQALERFLITEKGYLREDIAVDVDIKMTIAGEPYRSQVDLVVSAGRPKTRMMAIKCAAGSLGSRVREILAAARLLDEYPIPLAMVSDGKTAILIDSVTGKKVGEGLEGIPTREAALARLRAAGRVPLAKERREREKLIFRTYDSANVNVQRNIERS